jgi:nitrogen-specific signal transduction histidine kinase
VVENNLSRVLDELTRAQLEDLASIANLVGSVVHEIHTPVGAVTAAADVTERCAKRIRAILASVGNLDELRKNSQFERALDLVEENSKLIQAATQSICDQTAILREFVQRLPIPEQPSLARTLDEVLAMLECEEPVGKGRFQRDYDEKSPVLMKQPVIEWVLLECIRQVLALTSLEPIQVSTDRREERTVAVLVDFTAREAAVPSTDFIRWVRRAGAELSYEVRADSRYRMTLLLPCQYLARETSA